MELLTLVKDGGMAVGIIVIVWMFVGYIKNRDADRRHDTDVYLQQLNTRDDKLLSALDRNTEVLNKLDKNIDHLNHKVDSKSNN